MSTSNVDSSGNPVNVGDGDSDADFGQLVMTLSDIDWGTTPGEIVNATLSNHTVFADGD